MKKIISPLFCAALFFAACNDETTTVSATSDAEKVTAFKDLDNCDSTIVGKLVYVKDSVKAFICTDEGWAAMSGAAVGNGKSGKDGVDGKNGKDGKDGVDGKNGKNGKDGSDGKDGASCTVAAIEDGYKVLCGGDSVGVLLNGAKGDSGAQGVQGIQGKAGESCTAKENKADGTERMARVPMNFRVPTRTWKIGLLRLRVIRVMVALQKLLMMALKLPVTIWMNP